MVSESRLVTGRGTGCRLLSAYAVQLTRPDSTISGTFIEDT